MNISNIKTKASILKLKKFYNKIQILKKYLKFSRNNNYLVDLGNKKFDQHTQDDEIDEIF